MPGKCDICGKQPRMGNSITRRGKAKYLGGVGRKTTGVTRRQFRPNLQRLRVADGPSASKRVWICAKCLRSGRVQKRVKRQVPQPAAKV